MKKILYPVRHIFIVQRKIILTESREIEIMYHLLALNIDSHQKQICFKSLIWASLRCWSNGILYYILTSLQWPLWRQKKVATVNRGPLQRGVKEESMYGFLVCWDETKWPLQRGGHQWRFNCIVLQIAAVMVSLSLFTFVFSELSLLPVSEKRAQ